MRSPKTITLVESNPGSVDHYNVLAKRHSDSAQLASKNYAISGGTTVAPIGSDDFFASVDDGTVIDLYVIERGSLGDGPLQLAPGGPFTVGTYPDGAETISVQV